jgi:hypothetical protein
MSRTNTHDTRPFFRIRGRIGSRAVSAQFVDGCLTVDDAVWRAAMETELGSLVSHGGPVVETIAEQPNVAAKALLGSFDYVTYAQMGVEVRPDMADDDAFGQVPLQVATAGPCFCGNRNVVSEFHVGGFCPFGFRSSHRHWWCTQCGHQWVADGEVLHDGEACTDGEAFADGGAFADGEVFADNKSWAGGEDGSGWNPWSEAGH